MSCTSCTMEITVNHDSLECFGCGNKHHLSCLSSANKYFKKTIFNAIFYIENLLFFCNNCLPNITATFTRDKDQMQQHSNGTEPTIQSQQSQLSQQNSEQSNQLADLVIIPSTNFTDSIQFQTQSSIQNTQEMDTNELDNESVKCTQLNLNAKRRRISIENIPETQNSALSQLVSNKVSSTNYRCIYLTPFKPSTVEMDILKYIDSQNRCSTEIMECKKLLPEKCNTKKLSFVSFKLTVHKEFYDVYLQQSFWPIGVTASEFIVHPPKTHSKPKSQSKSQSKKFRVNPFAVRKPQQSKTNSQTSHPIKQIDAANYNKNRNTPKLISNVYRQKFTASQNKQATKYERKKVNSNSNSNQKNRWAPSKVQSERKKFRRAPSINQTQTHHRVNQFMDPKELRLLNQMVSQLSSLLNRF